MGVSKDYSGKSFGTGLLEAPLEERDVIRNTLACVDEEPTRTSADEVRIRPWTREWARIESEDHEHARRPTL
jgi:hypothetical protein